MGGRVAPSASEESGVIRVFNQYISSEAIMLIVVEGGWITLALMCGVRIRFWGSAAGFSRYIEVPEFIRPAFVFVSTLQVCFYYCDLYNYNLNATRSLSEPWNAVGQSIGSGCLLLGFVYFLFSDLLFGRGIFFVSVVLVPVLVRSSRAAFVRIWQSAASGENLLILGAGDLARTVGKELLRRNDLSGRLVGFVDARSRTGSNSLLGCPVMGEKTLRKWSLAPRFPGSSWRSTTAELPSLTATWCVFGWRVCAWRILTP